MSSSNPKSPLRTLLPTRFARGFSPSRWLRRSDGLRQLSEGGNGQEWILARGFSAYTLLDGAAVPPRKRRGFVDMAVSRWSPFPDPQSHVEWVGDLAMVWAWSRSRVLASEGEADLAAPRRILPESLFRGQPMAAGEELVAHDEGLEARAWRNGVMVASRWWPAMPGLPEWNDFRRGAGLQPAAALPEAIPYPLSERAWALTGREGIGETFGQYRNYLVAAAAGAACLVLAALLAGNIALRFSIWQVDKDIAAREQGLEKIISARDSAQSGLQAIEAELALRPPAGQVELMALVGELMRGQWQLQEWKLTDADHLQLTARMSNPDPRTIVKAWEGSGRFAEVTADLAKQTNTVVVKARILPARRTGGGR
jgi:hypothetical protein